MLSLVMILSSSCSQAISPSSQPAMPSLAASSAPTATPFPSTTPTATPAPTNTLTPSATPAATSTPTVTLIPTITFTPTPAVPRLTVQMQAACQYGPGVAYLYSWGLYKGDQATIYGKNYTGTWLWVKPDNLNRNCWVAKSVVEVSGDLTHVHFVTSWLPRATNLYGPPQNVEAVRQGDEVIVTWDPVWMTKDDNRGYLIEATVCRDGQLIPIAVHSDNTSAEITDQLGCSGARSGKLYTAEKHGYTDSVDIPWPE